MEGKGEEPVMSHATGPSILSLLGVVLVILRLLGIITISWWIVTAPFWVPFVLFILVGVSILLTVLAITVFHGRDTTTRAADITNLNRLKHFN